jgi:hypothetical protein
MSFFAKLKSWIAGAFKKLPATSVIISSALNYCVPFVEQLDVYILPEIAPIANPILDKIKTGFAALAVTIHDASPAGTTNAKLIIASIKTNLALILPALEIKDPNTLKEAQDVVTLINGEIAAIEAEFGS